MRGDRHFANQVLSSPAGTHTKGGVMTPYPGLKALGLLSHTLSRGPQRQTHRRLSLNSGTVSRGAVGMPPDVWLARIRTLSLKGLAQADSRHPRERGWRISIGG